MAVPAPLAHRAPLFGPITLLCILLFLIGVNTRAAAEWGPANKAELADNAPKIDPEAGAEIVYHEVIVSFQDEGWTFTKYERNYIRAKIYNQRGVEALSKVDLRYHTRATLQDVAARTIKPNGTSIEVTTKDFFDRDLVKWRGEKLKAESFAPPALEPGSIVEYRYTIKTYGANWYFLAMPFQEALPTQEVKYRVRMAPVVSFTTPDIRLMTFNCENRPLQRDAERYLTFDLKNLPAAKEEPFQPPPINIESYALMYYTWQDNVPAKKYWNDESKQMHKALERQAKPTGAIKAALASITAPTDSDSEKLRKIYDFCRTKIVNRDRDTCEFTIKEREKLKNNETGSDTLKNKNGTSYDINMLFAALARASGFEARFVDCSNRSWMLFDPRLVESFVFRDRAVAIKVNDNWQFFDPGTTYLPFGALSWRHTDTPALISDEDGKSELVMLGGSAAEASLRLQQGTLQLESEGTLEGDVVETYSGQWEAYLKEELDEYGPQDLEKYVREEIQEYQKLAEVTSIKVENAANPVEPLKISYHLRIPEYADRTGSRLFFQPAVFYKGRPPLFTEKTRRNDIQFHYRYLTQDEIRILPPDGFAVEEPSAPAPLDFGRLGAYEAKISLNRKTGEIFFRRNFRLDHLSFPVTDYAAVKDAFDLIHERDSHTLTLKRAE